MGWRDRAEVVQAQADAAPASRSDWRSRAEAVPPEEPGKRDVPVYETALEHGAQGLALGAAPKLVGAYAAGEGTGAEHGSPLTTAADAFVGLWRKIGGDPEAARRYVAAKEAEKAYIEETKNANPGTALLSEFAVGIAPSVALGAVAPVAKGAGFLSRVATGASQGATIGLGYGLGSGEDAGDVLGGVLGGAAGGAAVPVVTEGARLAISPAVRRLADALKVTPTAAAKFLEAQGVTNLTAGQKAGAGSIVGQLESVSAKIPMGVGAEREAAKETFQRVAQNKGLAPGATAPTSADLQARLKELFQGYGPVYDKIRDQPIPPDAIEALTSAASMPKRGVDARTAAGVKAEVENALTVVGIKPPAPPHVHGGAGAAPKPQGLVDQFGRDIPPPPSPPIKATAGDLMKVRENIREQIRAARHAQDFDRLRLLDGAEDVVTGAIESGLDPASRTLLQQTDRQYARLMTAANAAPSGQTGFTPLQYLKQVEKGAGRRAFKTGGAGDLQDLGEAARETFVDAPMTGWTTRVIDWLPGGTRLTAPASRAINWANTPEGQRFLRSFPNSPVVKSKVPPDVAAFISSRQAPGLRVGLPATADAQGDRP